MNAEAIKTEIKKSYGRIATSKEQIGCCSRDAACCTSTDSGSMTEDYSQVAGYQKDADLSLGCGLPTEIAAIRKGDTVVDLGSGAGNDAFVARSIVGERGRVIGIDMTPEMVIRALQNTQKLGYSNVEFMLGDIERMDAIPADTADVVVSNCVMNLVPDKKRAFAEVHRILKTGGHFSISDIVYIGALPAGVLEAAELYAGCIAGASEKGAYLGIVKKAGFKNLQVKKERRIELPDALLLKYISEEELAAYKASHSGIYSITLYADKLDEGFCCDATGSDCCGSDTMKEPASEPAACCGASTKSDTAVCCS